MFKKLRKNKKGFTLVEVIVVLVILAILAALMVPSMTGWIDKAKDQSILVKGRTALLAAQTVVSENYAKTPSITTWDETNCKAEFEKLAGTGEFDKTTVTIDDTTSNITKLVYDDGKIATYEDGVWTVAEA